MKKEKNFLLCTRESTRRDSRSKDRFVRVIRLSEESEVGQVRPSQTQLYQLTEIVYGLQKCFHIGVRIGTEVLYNKSVRLLKDLRVYDQGKENRPGMS